MFSLEPEAVDAILQLDSVIAEADTKNVVVGCNSKEEDEKEAKLTDEKFRDLTEVSRKIKCQGSSLNGVIRRY